MVALFRLRLQGRSLQGCEGTLEESIVDYIDFAVLAGYDPVAFRHAAEAGVGGNGFRMYALPGIYEQRSNRTECTHGSSIGAIANILIGELFP
jgi:hypothetical protein